MVLLAALTLREYGRLSPQTLRLWPLTRALWQDSIDSDRNSSGMFKKERTNPALTFIVGHRVSFIAFPLLFMIRRVGILTDPRLFNPREWVNGEDYPKVFYNNVQKMLKKKKKVIMTFYNPAVMLCIKDFMEECRRKSNDRILCLTFFHDDDVTSKIRINGVDDILDVRLKLLLNMANYPFLKKITVPYNFKITMKYLKELYEEHGGD